MATVVMGEARCPILSPNPDRYCLFPIKHANLWSFYEKHLETFWVASEIDFEADVAQFNALTPDEQHFIKKVLAFFAGSDGVVNENLCTNFSQEVQVPEARAYYTVQQVMETVHSHAYSLMIDRLVRDPAEKQQLFTAIRTDPAISEKAKWAFSWMNHDRSFGERLVAFACLEGIQFSASFASIFWLKKRGLCPGLCQANALISRDEGLHTTFAVELFKMLAAKPTPAVVQEIVRGAVEAEEQFVDCALPVAVIGMNSRDMKEYVRFVADRLLLELGVDRVYGASNPFPWMEQISMQRKVNFFEDRVTEYRFSTLEKATLTFDDDDF